MVQTSVGMSVVDYFNSIVEDIMKKVVFAGKTIIIICVLTLTACLATHSSFSNESPDSVFEESKVLIIDVRTAREFSKGCIEGAINIPFNVIANEIADVATSKDQAIVLYCTKGVRAWLAQRSLKKRGYNNVINEGSYKKIIKSGKYKKSEPLIE